MNRFSERWPSQPWRRINLWSRRLDGAANWVLFTVKCLFFLPVTFGNVWFFFICFFFFWKLVLHHSFFWNTQKLRLSIQLVYRYLLCGFDQMELSSPDSAESELETLSSLISNCWEDLLGAPRWELLCGVNSWGMYIIFPASRW